MATATTESVPLAAVRGVMLTHVVTDPAAYRPGSLGRELTLTIGWGAVSRLDLVPATCGDTGCEADHGYEGTRHRRRHRPADQRRRRRRGRPRPGHDVRPRALGDDRALSTDAPDGSCLPPGLRRRPGWPGSCPPSPRSLGVPGRRRAATATLLELRALAQRGGRAGRRPGLRPAAPAQRPRAVPAQPAARGPPARRRVPLDHRHQHGHVRHRPAAGRPRPGRLRGAGARGGPAAQRAVLGERPRPAALAAAADRLRAGRPPTGWLSPGSVPASSTGRA